MFRRSGSDRGHALLVPPQIAKHGEAQVAMQTLLEEVISGVLGDGVAGFALGAFAASSGSCQKRLVKAAQASGEGATVQAAGS